MSKSLTAVLLSAFIYPGSGHFFLKKYVQAVLLASVATVCLYFLLLISVEVAQEISARILNGEIPIDISEISREIWTQLAGSELHQANLLTYSFFICWLVSIVDSYRLAYKEDKNNRSNVKKAK